MFLVRRLPVLNADVSSSFLVVIITAKTIAHYQNYICKYKCHIQFITIVNMKTYIPEEYHSNLVNFKYKGGSISYSYRFIWGPLAEFCLKFVPEWVAPNVLTLTGIIICLIGNLNIILTTVRGEPVTPWKLLFFSLCLFLYQTLDNMDGKQARRTGNSTALGMLMDHGCDAFGVLFFPLAMGMFLQAPDSGIYIVIGYAGVWLGFYFSAWIQHHSNGIMILSEFNAVDDGIPLIWSLSLATFFLGGQQWTQTVFVTQDNVKYNVNHILGFGVIVLGALQMPALYVSSRKEFTANLLGASYDVLHYVLGLLIMSYVILFTDIQTEYFYQFYFTLGLMYSKDCSYLMVSTVAQMKYKQWQTNIVIFLVSYTGYLVYLHHFIPAGLFIHVILGVQIFAYAHYAISATLEMATILNVNIFKIKKVKL